MAPLTGTATSLLYLVKIKVTLSPPRTEGRRQAEKTVSVFHSVMSHIALVWDHLSR